MCMGSVFTTRIRCLSRPRSRGKMRLSLTQLSPKIYAFERLSVCPSATFPRRLTSRLPFPPGPLVSVLSALSILSSECSTFGTVERHPHVPSLSPLFPPMILCISANRTCLPRSDSRWVRFYLPLLCRFTRPVGSILPFRVQYLPQVSISQSLPFTPASNFPL